MREPSTSSAAAKARARRRRQVGPYRLQEKLGCGAMGEVFRAYDERLDRWVAIKRIFSRADGEQTGRKRFLVEARAAARLSHPAIVQVHDILQLPEGDFIVMELAEGRSLADLLAAGRLPPALALAFAVDIAAGLGAAHAEGIVHRDLKKENIVITPAGRPKILDFGLAKDLQPAAGADISRPRQVIGTPRAMAPEQARGDVVDARTDLFALGSLLYEMLTGVAPFDATGAAESMDKVLAHDPPPPSRHAKVPRSVDALLKRLLQKSPASRPEDAARVQAELRRLLIEMTGDDDISSLAAMSHELGPAPAAGRRIWLVAGCALLSVLAILLAWWQPWREARVVVAIGPFETLGDPRPGLSEARLPQLIAARVERLEGIEARLTAQSELTGDTAYLVAGTVQWSASELVSVRPRLVRLSDETLVWQDHFRQPAEQISGLRVKVAEAVARVLEAELGLEAGAAVELDRPAERYLLDGRVALALADSESSSLRALLLFRRASELESLGADYQAELAEALVTARLGGFLLRPSSLREASDAASRALEIDAGSRRARMAAGSVLAARGELEAALEAFDIAASGAEASIGPALHRRIGWTLRRLGDGRRARAHLRLAQRSPPRAAEAEDLASLEAELGDVERAIGLVEQALDLDPEHPRLRRAAARLRWLQSGSPAAALAELVGASSRAGSAPGAVDLEGRDATFAAWAALADQRAAGALELLASAPPVAYFEDRLLVRDLLRAWALRRLGRPARPAFDSARRTLEAEVALAGDARALACLALAHAGLGQPNAAKKNIERALERAAADAVVRRGVAIDAFSVFEQLGESERALAIRRQIEREAAPMSLALLARPPWPGSAVSRPP